MSLEFAHGAIQWLAADAVGVTYIVSGLSFQPKALRFYWQGLGSAVDAVSETTHSRRGIGFATSTTDRRCVGSQDQDAAASMICTSGYRTDAVAMTLTSTPAADGLLDLDAILADGFRLIVDDVAPVNITIFWEAWGGTDITNAATGEIAEPAATGNVDYVVPGSFQPDVLMLAGVQATGAAPTAARNDSGLCVGFATGIVNQSVIAGNNDDGSAAADTDGYGQRLDCLTMIAVAGGLDNARAQLNQFNADGFQLGWFKRATTGRKNIYLAVKGGQWSAEGYTINNTTVGNTTTVSGLPFQPKGICLFGANKVGGAAVQDRIGLGTGTSPTSRRSMGHLSENATASAEIDLVIEYDQVLAFPTTAGGLDAAYDIDAILADGFRIVVDDVPTTTSTVEHQYYLTFGDAAAPAADDLATKLLFLPDFQRTPGMLMISQGG